MHHRARGRRRLVEDQRRLRPHAGRHDPGSFRQAVRAAQSARYSIRDELGGVIRRLTHHFSRRGIAMAQCKLLIRMSFVAAALFAAVLPAAAQTKESVLTKVKREGVLKVCVTQTTPDNYK